MFMTKGENMYKEEIISVMKKERDSIDLLIDLVDEKSYSIALEILMNCKGKVVFMGIGKSGHIGEKLAATFSSTGTPSFFVNCAESFHGDFGMIGSEDVVILMSNSGTTKEVVSCIAPLKSRNIPIIAITKNIDSPLAQASNVTLLLQNNGEADHLNLAPTNSSTATLVIGDALACVLSKIKNFSREDFHRFHPGGALGQQLEKETK